MMLKIFFCYARKDKRLRDDLEGHLKSLRHSGQIITWCDREILPGTEWKSEIDAHLRTSDIILLLVSPHFLDSDYCYSVEMRQALERHRAGEARVIPIILRPVHWKEMPIGDLQALPTDRKPITKWRNRDDAFVNIVEGIKQVLDSLTTKQQQVIDHWLTKASVYWEDQLYDKAISAYEEAIKVNAKNAAIYQSIRQLDLSKTLSLLEEEQAFLFREKGLLLESLERYEDALAAYDQSVCIDPYEAYNYVLKGLTLQKLGRYDEALFVYEQHIALNPPSDYTSPAGDVMLGFSAEGAEIAYIGKANMLRKLQRYEDALAAYQQALDIFPTFEYSLRWDQYEILKLLGRDVEAQLVYGEIARLKEERFIEANPNSDTVILS